MHCPTCRIQLVFTPQSSHRHSVASLSQQKLQNTQFYPKPAPDHERRTSLRSRRPQYSLHLYPWCHRLHQLCQQLFLRTEKLSAPHIHSSHRIEGQESAQFPGSWRDTTWSKLHPAVKLRCKSSPFWLRFSSLGLQEDVSSWNSYEFMARVWSQQLAPRKDTWSDDQLWKSHDIHQLPIGATKCCHIKNCHPVQPLPQWFKTSPANAKKLCRRPLFLRDQHVGSSSPWSIQNRCARCKVELSKSLDNGSNRLWWQVIHFANCLGWTFGEISAHKYNLIIWFVLCIVLYCWYVYRWAPQLFRKKKKKKKKIKKKQNLPVRGQPQHLSKFGAAYRLATRT